MRLCIVGDEKKTKSNIKLVNHAKRLFDAVLYVPYSRICLKEEKKLVITYRGRNLSRFDIILPRIPKKRSLFAYFLLKSLPLYSPIKPQSFLFWSDRFLQMHLLRKEGLPTPDLYMVDSAKSASEIIKSGLSFPITMRASSEERGIMFANSEKEARAMLDTLKTFDTPIYIEDYFDSDYYQLLVVENRIITAIKRKPEEKRDMFFGNGKIYRTTAPSDVKKLAIDSAEAMKTSIASVNIVEKPRKIIGIDLCPNIETFVPYTKLDIYRELLEFVYESEKSKEKPISKFSNFLRELRSSVNDLFE